LEQENIALCKRLEKLERENTQLREEIMSIKDTVSVLLQETSNTKPDYHNNAVERATGQTS